METALSKSQRDNIISRFDDQKDIVVDSNIPQMDLLVKSYDKEYIPLLIVNFALFKALILALSIYDCYIVNKDRVLFRINTEFRFDVHMADIICDGVFYMEIAREKTFARTLLEDAYSTQNNDEYKYAFYARTKNNEIDPCDGIILTIINDPDVKNHAEIMKIKTIYLQSNDNDLLRSKIYKNRYVTYCDKNIHEYQAFITETVNDISELINNESYLWTSEISIITNIIFDCFGIKYMISEKNMCNLLDIMMYIFEDTQEEKSFRNKCIVINTLESMISKFINEHDNNLDILSGKVILPREDPKYETPYEMAKYLIDIFNNEKYGIVGISSNIMKYIKTIPTPIFSILLCRNTLDYIVTKTQIQIKAEKRGKSMVTLSGDISIEEWQKYDGRYWREMPITHRKYERDIG